VSSASVNASAVSIGRWSATLCTLLSLAYVLAQLAEWLGLLGSAGGPASPSTPLGLALLLTPSLLLGPAFVALTASIHYDAAESERVYSLIAVVCAAIYATLTGLVYYVQLAFVAPRMVRAATAGIELLLFRPFDSFLYAVDLLGYSFMSLATLCAAAVFRGAGLAHWIRRALIANGCLAPFLLLQMYFRPLIWGGSLWAVTFPAASWMLAAYFRERARRGCPTSPARVSPADPPRA
jgi:hypothetical protein